ncbi:BTB domain-containing protein [Frankliniella occidentalis]|uniref:Protein bric-a-brac 2-like isoform X2 n=1 Tax=Frankliniella occidentalis TaxID=133901 RepID=A0A6J1T5Z0_FRAOC|nr:protein bric-a-brac 2-like isoform X2 [Frankliniella occidentalis]KAE8753028.1 BTB domain-containing protein [Frankliniella occidentalis]
MAPDPQFCLRWNNFQTNITSQFETLRQDEDFVDVTLTCDGKSVKAHKVVLSACSPYFKELFKNNPCKHPIIILKDVQWCHLCALVEFMYAGVVNVSQAELPTFLQTAESLHILGLTDAPRLHRDGKPIKDSSKKASASIATPNSATPTNTDTGEEDNADGQSRSPPSSPPPTKRAKATERAEERTIESSEGQNSADGPGNESIDETGDPVSSLLQHSRSGLVITPSQHQNDIDQAYNDDLAEMLEPKTELPDYSSDGETRGDANAYLDQASYGGMQEMMPGPSTQGASDGTSAETDQGYFQDLFQGARFQEVESVWTQAPTSRRKRTYSHVIADGPKVTLGPGVEVSAHQLEALKWSDYRKLTRGLAGLVFTPIELATRSVTGQRWSRANTYGPDAANRKVKPALDNAKVNAILYHVKSIFPDVEVSRIKQVLAYKCQESSVAFKMKAGVFHNVRHQQDIQNQVGGAQDHLMNQVQLQHSMHGRQGAST